MTGLNIQESLHLPPLSLLDSLLPPIPPLSPLQVIRDTIKEIGYDDPGKGLDYNTMNVIVAVEEQSPDIAQSVDSRTGNVEDIGAGDQGIMFGCVLHHFVSPLPRPSSLFSRQFCCRGLL